MQLFLIWWILAEMSQTGCVLRHMAKDNCKIFPLKRQILLTLILSDIGNERVGSMASVEFSCSQLSHSNAANELTGGGGGGGEGRVGGV